MDGPEPIGKLRTGAAEVNLSLDDVRLAPKADIDWSLPHVRFVPIADISKISPHDPYAYKRKTASRRRASAVV